jgi:hypothetical protein
MRALDVEKYFDLLPNDVEEIDVSSEDLPYLPSLNKFYQLKRLYCSNNRLTELPVLSSQLEILDCHMNRLKILPCLPLGLKKLNCFQNELTSLPDLICPLILLDCANNQIAHLPSIPETLKYLICDHNRMTHLPLLPNGLVNLCCHHNPLPFVSLESWKSFQKFEATYYRLKYGRRLERFYVKHVRNKNINRDFMEILYSPDFGFYKRLLDTRTQDFFK